MDNLKDATDDGRHKSPVHSFDQSKNRQSNGNNENPSLIIPTKSPSKTRVYPM